MRNLKSFFALAGMATIFLVAAGCGDSASSSMTKEQEDAMRHPKSADPNFKGPDKSSMDKMGQEIAKYNEAHKNDKVQFNTGGG